MPAEKILVIDDEVDISIIIKRILELKGYEVVTASSGEEGLKLAMECPPGLIILDVMMKGINGYGVCQRLKKNRSTRFIPVIMLTGLDKTGDKITGIEAGSDDYLTKPFDLEELVTRVRWILKRTRSQIAANPLTGLPGNPSIEEEIKERINKREDFAVLYLDIDNFKSYNDRYGYARGDEIIRLLARILIESVEEAGEAEDFIGHIGGDDFIIITTFSAADTISSSIMTKFDQAIPEEYSLEDREAGYVRARDRQGNETVYSLMTISIARVTNEHAKITHHAQVAERAVELKRYAKSKKGSIYVKDRRVNGG